MHVEIESGITYFLVHGLAWREWVPARRPVLSLMQMACVRRSPLVRARPAPVSPIRWHTCCDGPFLPSCRCVSAGHPPPLALPSYRRVSGTYRRPDCAPHLHGKGYEAIRYDPALDTQLR